MTFCVLRMMGMPHMAKSAPLDPYEGNILIQGLGPIRSREQVAACLTELPRAPPDMHGVPPHLALHLLMELRDFHIPSLEECRLHQTIDLMIRPHYRYLNPVEAGTWAFVGGESLPSKRSGAPSFGAAVIGHSGTGKTEAITRCLSSYPQIIRHQNFPRLVGEHAQLTWLSAEVPASGRTTDLAAALMRSFDAATGFGRFTRDLEKARRDGMKMLDEWTQVASSHFLGILHLDEVQNFFKLSTLEKRRKRKGVDDLPELSIVEDQCLKGILNMMNMGRFAVLLSGTPDGISAIMRRLSNTERIAMSGYHLFRPFESAQDSDFRGIFLRQLGRYQYVKNKLPIDDALAELIIERTGGIQRLVIALWIAAHRVALERNSGDLRLTDFSKAADTFLAPVASAISALRSGDPKRMARYEDLLPDDVAFWSQYWGSVSRPL